MIFLQDMHAHQAAAAIAALAALSLSSFGQAGKAELFGAIQDPQGLPAAKARVVCKPAGGGSLLPRINGSRPRTNEYLYDGISVLQPEPGQVPFYPIIDAIKEFRLNLNAYSPEYGRSNGGTVMVIGKPGGNDFHGTLFEF